MVCHKKRFLVILSLWWDPLSGWVNLCRDLIVRSLVTAVPWHCLIGQPVLSGS